MSSFTLQTSDCRLDCGCAQGMPLHNPSFLLIRDQVQPGSCFSSGSVRCNLARACVLSARVHCLLVAPCRRRFTAPHRARATCMTCTLTMPLASAFSCSLLRYVETSSVICPLNVPAQLIRWQRGHHEHILSAAAVASDRAVAVATLHPAADVKAEVLRARTCASNVRRCYGLDARVLAQMRQVVQQPVAVRTVRCHNARPPPMPLVSRPFAHPARRAEVR